MTKRVLILTILSSILGLWAPQAVAQTAPPPKGSGYPRSLADWHEPRMGMMWHGKSLHAALGSPVVLVSGGRSLAWRITLEGLASLGLSREGSFFPLETVDGHFLLGGEAAWSSWRAKLRVVHWSAHKADGDRNVAYRDKIFSREWVSVETGLFLAHWFLYGRMGMAWHAIPHSPGLKTALGLLWESPGAKTGFFYAGHLEAEEAQSYRLSQSHLAGLRLGSRDRSYLGLRYHSGVSFSGQDLENRDTFLGVEIQFQPWATPSRPE